MPHSPPLHEGRDQVGTGLVGCDFYHAFDIVGGRGLGGFHFVGGAAGDVDRVDVHVRGEPWQELFALPAEHVDDAGGKITGREHFAQGGGGAGCCLWGEGDGD